MRVRAASTGLLLAATACGGERPGPRPSALVSMASHSDAAASESVDAATPEESTGSDVQGTVVSLTTGRPLSQRLVLVEGRRATTDDQGRFAFSNVGPSYDAVVMDPGGAVLSIYRGVERRDPLLPHTGVATASHRTTLAGDVSGGGDYPLSGQDAVVVSFFSDRSTGSSTLSAQFLPPVAGPAYGPMTLGWEGPPSIDGVLTALGTFHSSDGGVSSFFARRPQTLDDGQSSFANLALTPVPGTLHLKGTMAVPAESTFVAKRIFYRPPLTGAVIPIASKQSATIDDDVPDIGYAGADLCVSATAGPGELLAQECGVSADHDVTLTLQQSPTLASPAEGTAISKDTPFAWTAFATGVYILILEAVPLSPTSPFVEVFTAGTTSTWPDLSAAGIPFPVGADYECSITGVGPFTSLDEALGPDGVGAPNPAHVRRSTSPVLDVTTGP